MLIYVNAKGFFLPDGQRPSKRDLLDLQCVRGRQYSFCIYCLFNIYSFYIQGRQYEHSGVCALLEQVDKKGVFLLNTYRLLRLELCQIVRPKSAIIIVDVQNDFISGDYKKNKYFHLSNISKCQIYLNIKYNYTIRYI